MTLPASPRRLSFTINFARRSPQPLAWMTHVACSFHSLHDAEFVLDKVFNLGLLIMRLPLQCVILLKFRFLAEVFEQWRRDPMLAISHWPARTPPLRGVL